MSDFFRKNRNYLVTGIAGLATAILFIGMQPTLIQAAPVSELSTEPLPSTQTQPLIVDTFQKAEWHPKGKPTAGNPQLIVVELQEKPDRFNKINFSDASWIQIAVKNQAKAINLGELDREGFFDFYENAKSNVSYFEVTFPDGSVKYYDVMYTEVP